MTTELIKEAEDYIRSMRGKADKTTPKGIRITHYPRYTYLLKLFCKQRKMTQREYVELVIHFEDKYRRK